MSVTDEDVRRVLKNKVLRARFAAHEQGIPSLDWTVREVLSSVSEDAITDEEIKAGALALFQMDWGATAFPSPPSHTRLAYLDKARTVLINARAVRGEAERREP